MSWVTPKPYALLLAASLCAAGCNKTKPGEISSATRKGPLGPLADVAKPMIDGTTKLLGGKSPKKPFGKLDSKVSDRVRKGLAAVEAKGAVMIGMEFELLFHKGDKAVYYLRTFAHPGPDGFRFLNFTGRVPRDGRLYVSGMKPSAYTGAAAPIGKAGEKLIAALSDGKCKKLRIADSKELAKLLPDTPQSKKMLLRLKMAKAKKMLTCDDIEQLSYDRVELRIDDVMLGVRGEDGKLTGMIKGDLRARDGKLGLRLTRFRPM